MKKQQVKKHKVEVGSKDYERKKTLSRSCMGSSEPTPLKFYSQEVRELTWV